VILKVYYEILVSLGLVQNFKISDFVMAKIEKVNIAETYSGQTLSSHDTKSVQNKEKYLYP